MRSFIFHVKSLEPLKAPVGRVVIHEFQHTASSPKHSDYFLKLTVTHRLLFAHDMNVRKWYEDLLWIAFSSKQCFNWLVWNVHGHLNKNVPGPCSSSVVIFTMGLPNMKLAFFISKLFFLFFSALGVFVLDIFLEFICFIDNLIETLKLLSELRGRWCHLRNCCQRFQRDNDLVTD